MQGLPIWYTSAILKHLRLKNCVFLNLLNRYTMVIFIYYNKLEIKIYLGIFKILNMDILIRCELHFLLHTHTIVNIIYLDNFNLYRTFSIILNLKKNSLFFKHYILFE